MERNDSTDAKSCGRYDNDYSCWCSCGGRRFARYTNGKSHNEVIKRYYRSNSSSINFFKKSAS